MRPKIAAAVERTHIICYTTYMSPRNYFHKFSHNATEQEYDSWWSFTGNGHINTPQEDRIVRYSGYGYIRSLWRLYRLKRARKSSFQ